MHAGDTLTGSRVPTEPISIDVSHKWVRVRMTCSHEAVKASGAVQYARYGTARFDAVLYVLYCGSARRGGP